MIVQLGHVLLPGCLCAAVRGEGPRGSALIGCWTQNTDLPFERADGNPRDVKNKQRKFILEDARRLSLKCNMFTSSVAFRVPRELVF